MIAIAVGASVQSSERQRQRWSKVSLPSTTERRRPWNPPTLLNAEGGNKGKLVGQKAPLRLKEIWAIRVRLQMRDQLRKLALFDSGIDSKLRACDLVKVRVRDVCLGDRVAARAMVLQQKTQRPVQFEITPPTREAWRRGIRQTEV